MENEKNGMKKKSGKVLPWVAAVLLLAALVARAAVPAPAGLFTTIWNISTQLIILFSGLVLFSAVARAVFQRVSPSSNHGKTVFTLALDPMMRQLCEEVVEPYYYDVLLPYDASYSDMA